MRFKDKTAIVTGSGRGQGKETALIMASEGADVTINDIQADVLDQARKEIEATGAGVLAVEADMTKEDQVADMVDQTLKQFGKVDILVNVVGGTYATRKRFTAEITDEEWHDTLDLNLTSQFLCSRAVVPHMQKRGYGRIVCVSSMAGLSGESLLWAPPYSAAKAGVLGLTRQMALEFGPYGITVNAVAQSDTMTERTYDHFKDGLWPETQEEFMARYTRYALGHPAQPVDVARVIAFLASDDAGFMTGETVRVTGGALIE